MNGCVGLSLGSKSVDAEGGPFHDLAAKAVLTGQQFLGQDARDSLLQDASLHFGLAEAGALQEIDEQHH